MSCKFCDMPATIFEDDISLAFLDHKPLFPGHVLLIPKQHVETLSDLPAEQVGPFFANVQRLASAVESAMQAEGTFIAMNNRVSQSVPHLHVHIVPRRKGDGLKGFFWPRTRYAEGQEESVREAIRAALRRSA